MSTASNEPVGPASLSRALEVIGHDPAGRRQMIDALKAIEKTLPYPENRSVRDEITAPLIDALHADAGVLRKALATGLVFDFHYRSKIAREFVLSTPEAPDHVWEPQTTRLLVHLARRARQVLVGGGYFGDQVLPIAQALKTRGGTCHAFELNAEQAEMLRHNAALNALDNVVVNQVGLWSDDATELSLQGDDSFAFPKVAGGASPASFNTVTVDRYLRDRGVDRLDLIMLDIEGGELDALRGAAGQLARPAGEAPDIVFEVHRSYVDWSHGLARTPIVELVTSHGYTVHALRDFQANFDMKGKPIELIPLDTVYLEGPPHGFNLFAVKDRAVLDQGLGEGFFTIVPGVSPKLLVHKSPRLHHPQGGL
jgi:FkbM family methyltransferase